MHSYHVYNVDFEMCVGFRFLICVFLILVMCYFVLWVWHKNQHEAESMSYLYRCARQVEHKYFGFVYCSFRVYLQYGVYVLHMA